MTSREIVQRLIDEHILNGEEAFTLINDICKNEMYDVWKTLEGTKNKWYDTPSTIAVCGDNQPYTANTYVSGTSSASTIGSLKVGSKTYTVQGDSCY